MDGTLFDNSHRLHLLQEKNFDAYQAACVKDTLRMDIVEAILAKNYDAYVIASGRSAKYMMHTINVLPNEIASNVVLVGMRADDDYTSNVDIKRSVLTTFSFQLRFLEFSCKEAHIEWWDDNPKCFEGRVKGEYFFGRKGGESTATILDDFFLVEPVTNANTLS